MKTYYRIFLFLLILVLGKQGFTQYVGIYSSKSYEFVDFKKHGTFYALTENGTKMSNSRLEFDYGTYLINNDTLHLLLNNNTKNSLVNIVTFENTDSEYVSIKFNSIDKFSTSNLLIESFFIGNDSVLMFYVKDGETIKLPAKNISKINFACNSDNRKVVNFTLFEDEFNGNDILIQAIHATNSMPNKKFLIKDFSDISLTLIGPVIQDYKRKNRIKWFQSFWNWPWKWSFRKSHWYDPLEKKLIFNQCKKMYFFSDNNEYP